jgi:hypothetical protein
MTDFEHLQHMCLCHTLFFGDWQHLPITRKIQRVKELTETYLEIRKGSYRSTAKWVRNAIDGLYPEYAGLIDEQLPETARQEIHEWLESRRPHNQECPF